MAAAAPIAAIKTTATNVEILIPTKSTTFEIRTNCERIKFNLYLKGIFMNCHELLTFGLCINRKYTMKINTGLHE